MKPITFSELSYRYFPDYSGYWARYKMEELMCSNRELRDSMNEVVNLVTLGYRVQHSPSSLYPFIPSHLVPPLPIPSHFLPSLPESLSLPLY